MSDEPSDRQLELMVLDSIWQRILWDFLEQNPQLETWLQGSTLRATDDPDMYQLLVTNPDYAAWLGSHTFMLRRSLSQELKRPVVVRVVAREGVGG